MPMFLSFELAVFSSDPWHQAEVGLYAANCLGLVLERQKPKPGDDNQDSCDEDFGFLSTMMARMKAMTSSEKETIRGAVLSQGAKSFQILSCARSTPMDKNIGIRFYMSPSDYGAYRLYYVSILRTDGWFRVGKPVQLLQAQLLDD